MRDAMMRRAVKRALDACCLALLAPAAAMCRLEAMHDQHSEVLFTFWAQAFALVPGLPGVFVRRAFYRMTLDQCGRSFFVGFGTVVSHRQTTVGEDVYVGPYAIVGSAYLRRGCLICSRASIVSGGALHVLDADLRWTTSDLSRLRRIEIGEHAWIGEGSVVLADIGRSAMVAAGSVVSGAVPPATVVAGNPARFVRRLTIVTSEEEVPSVQAAVSIR